MSRVREITTGGEPDGIKRVEGVHCSLCSGGYDWADGCDNCKMCVMFAKENENKTLTQREEQIKKDMEAALEEGKTMDEIHKEIGGGTDGHKYI